jgi:hypothetical protein
MADEKTVRIDLSYGELEALAWAVWFAAPAALSSEIEPLDTLHAKLLGKRRQFRRPEPVRSLYTELAEPRPEP